MRFAELYTGWVIRRRRWILVASMVLAVLGGYLVTQLPVHTDFSALLPPDAPSVIALRKLEKRARAVSTLIFMIESDDPGARRAAAEALHTRVKQVSPDLISKISYDDDAQREFVWKNRWLFASLDELKVARDELKRRIRAAKLKENPLFVDLDDGPPVIKSSDDALERKLAEARAKFQQPSGLISKDGRSQMIVMYTTSRSGDGGKNDRLVAELRRIVDEVRATLPPGVEIGLGGDAVLNQAERATILNGMVLAGLVTVGLVLLLLLVFFKSPFAVASLMWSLVAGTLVTFAITRLTIGELNIATAFLSSIVVGNGINFGTVVAARYLEERRNGVAPEVAADSTLRRTFTGTLAAALTAAAAYASLIVTDFRGFRHFGVIGGVGMVVCWISAFTVLPAALLAVDRRGWLRPRSEPAIGKVLAALVPRRPMIVALVMAAITMVAGLETWRFFATDPFENNFRNLRSESSAAREESRWMRLSNYGFGRGVSSGFVMAVDDRAQIKPLVARLRALDEGKLPKQRLFARTTTLDDLLPQDQPEKIAILDEIRTLLSPDTLAAISDKDRAQLAELRPPDNLRPITEDDLPEALVQNFTERDGTRGRVVFALAGFGFDVWNANHILRFANKVRSLDLGEHVTVGAEAFVYADVLGTIERDGTRATIVALFGAVLVVVVILGFSRAAVVTLACAATGIIVMLASASLMGIKVNFLDFVALPITIGIGIDYAVNIVAREREEGSAKKALATVGGAVVMCSSTTIIGYGSLILSQNLAIKSFGIAAILGEVTCLLVALAFAPALGRVLLRERKDTSSSEVSEQPSSPLTS